MPKPSEKTATKPEKWVTYERTDRHGEPYTITKLTTEGGTFTLGGPARPATPGEIAAEQQRRRERAESAQHQRALRDRPEFLDADAIRGMIELSPETIIDRLPPEEWRELRQRLQGGK